MFLRKFKKLGSFSLGICMSLGMLLVGSQNAEAADSAHESIFAKKEQFQQDDEVVFGINYNDGTPAVWEISDTDLDNDPQTFTLKRADTSSAVILDPEEAIKIIDPGDLMPRFFIPTGIDEIIIDVNDLLFGSLLAPGGTVLQDSGPMLLRWKDPELSGVAETCGMHLARGPQSMCYHKNSESATLSSYASHMQLTVANFGYGDCDLTVPHVHVHSIGFDAEPASDTVPRFGLVVYETPVNKPRAGLKVVTLYENGGGVETNNMAVDDSTPVTDTSTHLIAAWLEDSETPCHACLLPLLDFQVAVPPDTYTFQRPDQLPHQVGNLRLREREADGVPISDGIVGNMDFEVEVVASASPMTMRTATVPVYLRFGADGAVDEEAVTHTFIRTSPTAVPVYAKLGQALSSGSSTVEYAGNIKYTARIVFLPAAGLVA